MNRDKLANELVVLDVVKRELKCLGDSVSHQVEFADVLGVCIFLRFRLFEIELGHGAFAIASSCVTISDRSLEIVPVGLFKVLKQIVLEMLHEIDSIDQTLALESRKNAEGALPVSSSLLQLAYLERDAHHQAGIDVHNFVVFVLRDDLVARTFVTCFQIVHKRRCRVRSLFDLLRSLTRTEANEISQEIKIVLALPATGPDLEEVISNGRVELDVRHGF